MVGSAVAGCGPRVLVMMATYNGERYVAEQIDSILAQEGVDLTLVIRDDGSTDGTVAVCERYAREHANVDFAVNGRNKGCALNFMDMVYSADAGAYEYFAFSDQDDYWLPEKLAKAIDQLMACNAGQPGLYYSDVVNVDADLSHPRSQNRAFATVPNPLKTALVFNWAAGCTMTWNSAMMKLVQKERNDVFPRFQDTWLFLLALTCNAQIYADLGHSYLRRRITGVNQTGENYGRFTCERILKHMRRFFSPPPPMTSLARRSSCFGFIRHTWTGPCGKLWRILLPSARTGGSG